MKIEPYLGQTIAQIRKSQGISQEDFARKAEINRAYMSSIENGKRIVSVDIIEKVADTLQMPLSDLFKEAEIMRHKQDATQYIRDNIKMDDVVYTIGYIHKNQGSLKSHDPLNLRDRIQHLINEYGKANDLPVDWWPDFDDDLLDQL